MLVIFTDLDGTLLDSGTYSFAPAVPALRRIRELRVPLILTTSKTYAEARQIQTEIGIEAAPLIVENGAAAWIPPGYFAPDPEPDGLILFGAPYKDVLATLHQASRETGAVVVGFADLTLDAVARLTGLPPEEAARARDRVHDEPFILADPSHQQALYQAVERLGRTCTRGGRFHHIIDPNVDKGRAAQYLRARFLKANPTATFLALGDAPNDVPMLAASDDRVIIRSKFADQLQSALPGARVSQAPGPEGWNTEVLQRLPPV